MEFKSLCSWLAKSSPGPDCLHFSQMFRILRLRGHCYELLCLPVLKNQAPELMQKQTRTCFFHHTQKALRIPGKCTASPNEKRVLLFFFVARFMFSCFRLFLSSAFSIEKSFVSFFFKRLRPKILFEFLLWELFCVQETAVQETAVQETAALVTS